MADIKSSLFTYLTGLTQISDLIGDRFFPTYAPSSADLPYTIYSLFAAEHDHHMLAASGLLFNMFEFDHYSVSSITVGNIREAFRDALDGFVGDLSGVSIRSIQLRNETESMEPASDSSQDNLFRVSQEYSIIQNETVPIFPA